MAFTFDDDKFTMEFTYQASRFEYGDEDYAVKIAREFLSDKLCAVEIFLSGKAIFGGTRETAGANFRSAEEFALWYSAGNTEVAEKLKRFLANDGATVKCFSWSGKYDRVARFENGSAKEV